MELSRYWRVFRRWVWLVVLLALTGGATAAGVSLQLTKQYAATSTAVVSPKQVIPASGVAPDTQLPSIDELVETYVGLINTGPVRDRLASGRVPRTPSQLATEISARRRPSTTLVDVTVTDPDPEVARLAASDIVSAFNSALDELQSKVLGGNASAHLESLVPWEIPTVAPSKPVSPNLPVNVALAAIVGALFGVGLAFLFERLDNTIKEDDQARTVLGLSLLGSVFDRRATREEPEQEVELVTAQAPSDVVSEQYRSLRTSISFAGAARVLQTIVVTSSIPGEGKTTTACNLAVALAQAGNSVILVDADFRRPDVHRVFRKPATIGLGNLILGDEVESRAILSTEVPNLRVVCSGPTPPNPSELLGSQAMERILARFKALADYVVIDTPPVAAVTDATVLGAMCDGTVLVVQRGRTQIPFVQRSIETLNAVGARILGVVLNRATAAADSYYSYYYSDEPPIASPAPPRSGPGDLSEPRLASRQE